MKKHVRFILAAFLIALAAGYVGLLSDNSELEQKLSAQNTSTTPAGDAR